jgi:hypothetical protein
VPKKHRGKGVATGLIRVVQGRAVGRKLLSSTEQWCVQMQHILRITVTPAVRNARKCATQNASKPPVMGSSVDGETPYCRSSRHPQRLQGSGSGRSTRTGELTLTTRKQSPDLATEGHPNVSSTTCSGRRPCATRSGAPQSS